MNMKTVFEKTTGLTDVPTHYCPGCTHGMIHRLIGEVMQEMDILEETIGVASVGCSVMAYEYFNVDMVQAAHGRAPAVATGIKRVEPNKFVFTYQGDGDLASIGIAEAIHAAARGENITVIFVNNCIYGMTGGQMAPTSLIGQKTATTPFGRDAKLQGSPIKVCEMLATLDGVAYIERCSSHDVAHLQKTKKAIRKAFETQKAGLGFSMVEVLSTCPTGWGIDAFESMEWIKTDMMPVFPLGVYKQ